MVNLVNADWEIYFEKGKVDEQIRDLSMKFYKYRVQIIELNNSFGNKIFNDNNTNFNSQFEGFLINFFSNIEEFNRTNYKREIYDPAFIFFKKDLYKSLFKRINERIICSITFSDGYSLYKLIKAFKRISNYIIIRINHKEIQAYSPNESKTCLMRAIFRIKNCQFYCNETLEISLKLDDILNLLKCRKIDLIHTRLIFREDKLDIELYSNKNKSKIKRSLKTIEKYFNEDGILGELLNLEHLNSFEIDKENFNFMISQSGRLSEAVKLVLSNNSIKFSEENSIGEGDIEWNNDIISNINLKNETIIAYFSIEYFKTFTDFLFESNPNIKIMLGQEIPIKIQVEFKSLEESYGQFFIAQREPF